MVYTKASKHTQVLIQGYTTITKLSTVAPGPYNLLGILPKSVSSLLFRINLLLVHLVAWHCHCTTFHCRPL